MDKPAIQQALTEIEEEIKRLRNASEVLKELLTREGVMIRRKGRLKGNTYANLISDVLREAGRPMNSSDIADRITASGKKQVGVTAIRLALNREKGKRFDKVDSRRWRLISTK